MAVAILMSMRVFIFLLLIFISRGSSANESQIAPFKVSNLFPVVNVVAGESQGTGIPVRLHFPSWFKPNRSVILTNSHILHNKKKVNLISYQKCTGTVEWDSPVLDLAIIKPDCKMPRDEMAGDFVCTGDFTEQGCALNFVSQTLNDDLTHERISGAYYSINGLPRINKLYKNEIAYKDEDIYISGIYDRVLLIPLFGRYGMSGSGYWQDGKLAGMITKLSMSLEHRTIAVPIEEITQVIETVYYGNTTWRPIPPSIWTGTPSQPGLAVQLTKTVNVHEYLECSNNAGGENGNGGGENGNGGGENGNGGNDSSAKSLEFYDSENQLQGFIANPLRKCSSTVLLKTWKDKVRTIRTISGIKYDKKNNEQQNPIPRLASVIKAVIYHSGFTEKNTPPLSVLEKEMASIPDHFETNTYLNAGALLQLHSEKIASKISFKKGKLTISHKGYLTSDFILFIKNEKLFLSDGIITEELVPVLNGNASSTFESKTGHSSVTLNYDDWNRNIISSVIIKNNVLNGTNHTINDVVFLNRKTTKKGLD